MTEQEKVRSLDRAIERMRAEKAERFLKEHFQVIAVSVPPRRVSK